MLVLRPNCECCDKDLPPESPDVMICSFECTFCIECVNNILQNTCPNCGGELVRRPVRPTETRAVYPASTERFYRPLNAKRLEKHAAYVKRYAGIAPSQR